MKMAMLAEPRQRKRYNLVPRGKALYEDDSRFGTKMLEKMGWSKGKGLGAKEDGSQDFVRVRYKNDAQGFGYEQRDDQWTQHEDSFNGLLKTLNGEEDAENVVDSKMFAEQSNVSEDDMPRVGFGFQDPAKDDSKKKADKPKKLKEKISGISLEERSKQSKARVHYKKFTKGKDLAQYSEKDLANIFGKKVVDEQQQAVNDYYEQLNKSFGKTEEETKENSEDDVTDKFGGVQIISSGVSVADYFKKKMDEMNNRRSGNNNPVTIIEKDTTTEVQEEDVSKIKKKKKKRNKDQEEEPQFVKNDRPTDKYASDQIIHTGVSVADYFNQKMEEKKNRLNCLAENKLEEQISIEIPEEEISKKKKKKNKHKEEVTENINNNEEKTTTKIKKIKNRDTEVVENISIKNSEDMFYKKDKSKIKERKDSKKQQNELKITMEEQPQTKKRKNAATEEIQGDIPREHYPEIDLTQEPEKKKKKKSKSKDSTEIIIIDDTTTELETTTEDKTNSAEITQEMGSKNNQSNISSTIKKSKKSKRTDVSNKELTLDDLKTQYQSYNIYQISSFCAEKFRNIDLNHFTGSALPQVDGYGLTQNIQLKVEINKNDEERITNLWSNTLDKYSQLQKPKKTYHHYVKEFIKARKSKRKRPKLYVKTWKRKNAFQII